MNRDEELHALLSEMLASLNDSHTFYKPPADPAAGKLLSRGFEVAEIEGRYVLTSVAPALAELQPGLRPGLVLQTIDGRPLEETIREIDTSIRRSYGFSSDKVLAMARRQALVLGRAGEPVALGFMDPMGHPVEARLDQAWEKKPEPAVTFRRLASGADYIRWTFWDDSLTKQVRAHLVSLDSSSGLVIDLRGNTGGDPQMASDALRCFFRDPVPFGVFYGPRKPPKMKANPCPRVYTRPMVVLMDGDTGSSSEIFANLIQETGRGSLIGRPSSASVVYHQGQQVRGGGVVWFSRWGYRSPQGRQLQGNGVQPDIPVEPTIAGIWEGRDEVLEAAERFLASKLQGARSAR